MPGVRHRAPLRLREAPFRLAAASLALETGRGELGAAFGSRWRLAGAHGLSARFPLQRRQPCDGVLEAGQGAPSSPHDQAGACREKALVQSTWFCAVSAKGPTSNESRDRGRGKSHRMTLPALLWHLLTRHKNQSSGPGCSQSSAGEGEPLRAPGRKQPAFGCGVGTVGARKLAGLLWAPAVHAGCPADKCWSGDRLHRSRPGSPAAPC